MPLTRDFKETIRARFHRDPKFRQALLREGVEAMLTGDVETAKTILRDYMKAKGVSGILRCALNDNKESSRGSTSRRRGVYRGRSLR